MYSLGVDITVMRFRRFTIAFLFAFAPGVRAQCDSTPPLMQPAFALVGDSINDHIGSHIYIIHDSLARAQLVVNVDYSSYDMRVYSRFSGGSDTTYRCCVPYIEAHECHVTRSRYADYVVSGHDSVFFIPGSPEGIWSSRKWLLTTPAAYARIAVGKFVDGTSEVIIIADFHRGVAGTIGYRPGQIWIWKHVDSTHRAPDTIVEGDTSSYAYSALGSDVAVADLDNDGIEELCVRSGGGGMPNGDIQRSMHVFWGGLNFPRVSTRWQDHGENGDWNFSSGPRIYDANRDGILDLDVNVHMKRDTVWSEVRSGWRDFVYAGVRRGTPFDTVPSLILRPPVGPNQTCVPGLLKFGSSLNSVGDVTGTGNSAFVIGDDGASGGSGALILYLGEKQFDTIPDAFFKGAAGAIGGIDFNGDSIGDMIIPRPGEGLGGVVQFVAGSRALRSFGVSAMHDGEPPRLQTPAFMVYPMPAHGQITLSWNGSSMPHGTVVAIVDMLGRVVRRVAISAPEQMITLDGLVPGAYRLTWVENTHSRTQSFIHIQ